MAKKSAQSSEKNNSKVDQPWYDEHQLAPISFKKNGKWKANLFFAKQHLFLTLGILIAAMFALLFWILNLSGHSGEPLSLTVIYRLYDYAFFPAINRWFGALLGEYFIIDQFGEGILTTPLAGVLPYGTFQLLLGNYGYIFSDIFSHVGRFLAFWLLMGILAHSRREQALGAIALMFCSSQYLLGDYSTQNIFRGIWGVRIPRDTTTSIYFILSIWALLKIPTEFSQPFDKKRLKKIVILALPLVALINGDVHLAMATAFTYFAFILYWISTGQIRIENTLAYLGAGVILNLPMFFQMSYVLDHVMVRFGRYPVEGGLALVTASNKLEILIVVLGLVVLGLLNKYRSLFSKNWIRLFSVCLVIYSISIFTTLVFQSITGFNIQEYQFSYRKKQALGFLITVSAVTLVVLYIQVTSKTVSLYLKKVVPALLVFSLLGVGTSFKGYYEFSSKMAAKQTPPEDIQLFNKMVNLNGWRKAASEVVNFFDHKVREDAVVATLDHQLLVSLLLQDNIYSYLPDPTFTIETDENLILRFLNFCKILNYDQNFVKGLISQHVLQLKYLFGGKMQFNRFHTAHPLGSYPPELLNTLKQRNDNWFLYTHPSLINSILQSYSQINPREMAKRFRQPDYLVLNKRYGTSRNEVSGYSVVLQNEVFQIFKKSAM